MLGKKFGKMMKALKSQIETLSFEQQAKAIKG